MLETILVLICVCLLELIFIRVQQRRIRNLEQHCASWRLLAEHYEEEARSW